MGSEVAFHLSGGIFFNLMLAARKKPTVNQKECLRELLYIFDRSARGLSGNSLGTIASRFRNCDPKLRSVYIKFGDPVLVNEFNERMREDYDSVVGEVKNYADHYLDLKMNGKWLVRALMELVEKDSLIQNNAKFMAIPGGRPAYKQDFPEMQKVYIYNMLLGGGILFAVGQMGKNTVRKPILHYLILMERVEQENLIAEELDLRIMKMC